MSNHYINFAIGSLILLLSTHILVRLAQKVSAVLKVSPLVVGITIVSLCTVLPELSFSIAALVQKDVGLAMGNIVGSNIVNILLVLPVGILIGKLRIGTTKTQRSALFLLLATVTFIWFQFSSIPDKLVGIVLVSTALIMMIIELTLGFSGSTQEDKKMFKGKRRGHFSLLSLFGLLVAVGGIIFGSSLAVGAVEEISLLTGLSTTVLGLSLTAVVTSLPELLTVIFSQEEGEAKITIGNVIGSNLYNLLLIGGIVVFFTGKSHIPIQNLAIMGGSTALFIFIIRKYKGKIIPWHFGLYLLLLMGLYIFSLKF